MWNSLPREPGHGTYCLGSSAGGEGGFGGAGDRALGGHDPARDRVPGAVAGVDVDLAIRVGLVDPGGVLLAELVLHCDLAGDAVDELVAAVVGEPLEHLPGDGRIPEELTANPLARLVVEPQAPPPHLAAGHLETPPPPQDQP